MEKIENLQDLAKYLKDNISEKDLFTKEDESLSVFDNFQNGFESGYANSYANLLCLLDEDFKKKFNEMNSEAAKWK